MGMTKLVSGITLKTADSIIDKLYLDEDTGKKGYNLLESPGNDVMEAITNIEVSGAEIKHYSDDDVNSYIFVTVPYQDKFITLDMDFVTEINGQVTADIDPFNDKSLIKLTKDYFLDVENKVIKHIDDLEVCADCGAPLDLDDLKICSQCLEGYYNIRHYRYTPEFTFFGTQKGKHEKDNNIWFGIELEYGLETNQKMARFAYKHSDRVYLKSDGSISGGNYKAEMVTHPHSFKELMKEDSWINDLNTLDAVDNPDSNGCHIHISRTAFKSDKHFAKFKYLMLSNQNMLEEIGGRQINDYSKFQSDEPIKKTSKDKRVGEKYRFMNQSLEHTFELRFMGSTTSPAQVKRYIQFAHAMILYTAYHHRKASYKGFADYVAKYAEKYPELSEFIKLNKDLIKGEVTVPEYKRVTKNYEDLKVKELSNIIKVLIVDKNDPTNVYKEITNAVGTMSDSTTRISLDYCDTSEKVRRVGGHDLADYDFWEKDYKILAEVII